MAPVRARGARTPRLAPQERRRQLLDTALAVAEEEGFDAVTVAAVVGRAGVTRPVLYDLFGDLDGLLLALIAREEERALAVLAEVVVDDPGTRDPDAYLVAAVARLLEAVHAAPRTWRLVLLPPQGSPEVLRERIEASRAAVTARVEALLDWGLAARGGPAGLDHPVLAHLLVAAGEDAARLVLAHPRRFTPPRVTAAARGFLSLLPPGPAVVAQEGTSLPVQGGEMCPPQGDEALAPPSGRMPQAQRREQLLDVTLALIARGGFDGLSVEAVAREAGVNRVVVYRSFASLHVLLGALLVREQRRVERALDAVLPRDPGARPPDRPPAEVLVDGLDGLLRAVAAAPLTWRVALAPAESAPVALRAVINRRRGALERRVRRLVAWGAGGLAVPAEQLDAEVLARMILSLAEQNGRLLLDGVFPPDRLRAAAATLVAGVAWVRPGERQPQK